jgi:hypothetical protein
LAQDVLDLKRLVSAEGNLIVKGNDMRGFLALVLALLGAGSTRAQGTFSFNNRVVASGLDAPVFFSRQPLEAPMVAAVFLNGTQLGPVAPFRTGVGAGYWNPGAEPIREVIGKFSGDVVSGFTIKAWDSSKGQTMETVRDVGGKYGESRAFSITLGGPKSDPLLPADIPGVMSNFRSYDLLIPEPSVLALGALGAVICICRRRRS